MKTAVITLSFLAVLSFGCNSGGGDPPDDPGSGPTGATTAPTGATGPTAPDVVDDRPYQGAHAAARHGPIDRVVLGLLPALAYRRVDGDVANDRLRADHARVVVLGSCRLRGNH